MIEREIPMRVAIARRTIEIHARGRCEACPPDGELAVCDAFRCAIRRLLDHADIPYITRFSS